MAPRHEAEGWSCCCLLLAEVTLTFQTQDTWTVGEKLHWRQQSNVSLPHQWSLQWIKERKRETRCYSICCKLTWLYKYIHILIPCFSLSWGDNLGYWGWSIESYFSGLCLTGFSWNANCAVPFLVSSNKEMRWKCRITLGSLFSCPLGSLILTMAVSRINVLGKSCQTVPKGKTLSWILTVGTLGLLKLLK